MNSSMMLSADSISVIICAYTQERWDKLTLAVASIHKQTHPAQEIIVVIDHNQDLLQKAQRELVDVRVIENTGGQGLSGARNSGVDSAFGAFIAFLDDDAIAEPDWLLHMHTALTDAHIQWRSSQVDWEGAGNQMPHVAPSDVGNSNGTMPLSSGKGVPSWSPNSVLGVGSAVMPDWEGQEPPWFPAEFYWVVGCSYRGMPRRSAPIRNPIGASMCIRREVFQAVGGFRSEMGRVGTLPVGCEETELCIRACQYWPERYFLYMPQVSVSHFVPKKRATWHYFGSRCYAEGISKAVVGRFVGTKDSLSSESAYTLRTLPVGILRNISRALIKRRFSGILRASAIVFGLCMTTAGYLVGKYTSLSPIENVEVSPKAMGIPGKRKVVL